MNHPIAEAFAVMIPVVAIVMGVGIGMLSLYLQYRKKRDISQLYHQERMAAIEKGIDLPPLPPEFFQDSSLRDRSPARHRRSGLILLFLGITIAAGMYTVNAPYVFGLVPAAIGLAYLVSSVLEARELKRSPPPPGGPVDRI